MFIAEDSARYYTKNAKTTSNGQRRHSIGTFMGRERSESVASRRSFREDFPQAIIHATSDGDSVDEASLIVDDHALRHASYPRKRCPRCTRGECNWAEKKTTENTNLFKFFTVAHLAHQTGYYLHGA